MKNFFVNLIKQNGIQPILTVILVIVIVIFAFQFWSRPSNNNVIREVELTKKVPFEDAANRFMNEDFEVLTRGALYVKDQSPQNVNPGDNSSRSTPTPSITQIALVENKYEDVFFTVIKGSVQKVDAKTFGINGSIFFNSKGQLVFIDNVNRQYTLYKIPADTEKQAVQLFEGIRLTFNQNIFPLTPLINDYKAKKFNPIENSSVQNIYSGKWQHPVYTSGEVVDVIIQTDPSTGLFDSMSIAGTNPPSQLFFDFKKIDNLNDYDKIPDNYKSIPVPVDYKVKEGQ